MLVKDRIDQHVFVDVGALALIGIGLQISLRDADTNLPITDVNILFTNSDRLSPSIEVVGDYYFCRVA